MLERHRPASAVPKAGADMADGLRINKVEYGRQCVETPDFSAGGVAFFDGAAEKADDVEQKVFTTLL